ncbi:hypothetical protein GCK32_000459 [Trichostrongylus colubriformis]|uniref:Uncharacterized protein n=1 Tax=Trichostrongylus colubriformis TaxID=6319 RepID=A0AAN8EN02_TRICO
MLHCGESTDLHETFWVFADTGNERGQCGGGVKGKNPDVEDCQEIRDTRLIQGSEASEELVTEILAGLPLAFCLFGSGHWALCSLILENFKTSTSFCIV